MRPLRYSINVKLDGYCDHRFMIPDEELHRHATQNLQQADAILFGRLNLTQLGVTIGSAFVLPLIGNNAS